MTTEEINWKARKETRFGTGKGTGSAKSGVFVVAMQRLWLCCAVAV